MYVQQLMEAPKSLLNINIACFLCCVYKAEKDVTVFTEAEPQTAKHCDRGQHAQHKITAVFSGL